MGANVLAIFPVPNGWMRKTRTMMAHETPTTVDCVMFELTTVILDHQPVNMCADCRDEIL